MSFVDLSLSGENASDQFGQSLAMSADGSRFLVGAHFYDNGASSNTGRIYSCSISNDEIVIDSSYVGQAANESLGVAVALDISGERYVACGRRGAIRIGTISESGDITETHSGTSGLAYDGTFNTYLSGCAVNSDRTILATTHSNYDSDELTNNGQLIFYTIPTDGTGLTFVDSVDGTVGQTSAQNIALNSDGDRFIWGGGSSGGVIYLGTFNGTNIAIVSTITGNGSGIGSSVDMTATGDRFVAGSIYDDNSGGFYVGTFDGTSAVLDSSYAYDGDLTIYVGTSIATNVDGSRFIVGGANNNAGLILLGSISEAGAIEVDGTYIGENSDYYLGQVIATDSSAMTFVSSGSTSNSLEGAIYYAEYSIPDADGDGIGDPTDIFANQQLNVVPTAIPGLTNVFAIAPGKHHTLAITRDGRVLSFGRNQSGQLGRLVTDVSGHVPADVSGALNAYPAIKADARLEGGDAFERTDVYSAQLTDDSLRRLLALYRTALRGNPDLNSDMVDDLLAEIGKR
jgi:hypothetical protein